MRFAVWSGGVKFRDRHRMRREKFRIDLAPALGDQRFRLRAQCFQLPYSSARLPPNSLPVASSNLQFCQRTEE